MGNLVSSDRSGVQRLYYDRPAGTWLEALPLGNGRIGAMCFGGVGRDRIGLNDETLWSGGPETARLLSTPLGATGAEAVQTLRDALRAGDIRRAHELAGGFHSGYCQAYLPLGDLLLEVRVDGTTPAPGDVAQYRRRARSRRRDCNGGVRGRRSGGAAGGLRQCAGRCTGCANDGVRAGTGADVPVDIATAVASTRSRGRARIVAPGSGRCRSSASRCPGADSVLRRRGSRHGSGHRAARLERRGDPRRRNRAHGRGRHRSHPDPLHGTGYAGPSTSPTRSAAECWAAADQTVLAARDRAYGELVADHREDHRRLFRRSSLELAGPAGHGELPTDLRVRGRGRRRGPCPGCAAVQLRPVPDGREFATGWPADEPAGDLERHPAAAMELNYTVNINTEMNYWPAETTNLSECHEPLLRYIDQLAQAGRRRPVNGTAAVDGPRTTTPTHGAGRSRSREIRGGRTGRWQVHGWPGHLWDHYAFTGDLEFLGGSWRVLLGAAEFCLDWLVELPDGTLGTAPSTSPENDYIAGDGQPASVTGRRPWTWPSSRISSSGSSRRRNCSMSSIPSSVSCPLPGSGCRSLDRRAGTAAGVGG